MEKIGFVNPSATPEKDNYDDVKSKVMASLKDYFRPEFLNRVDDIILFDILSRESIEKIVEIQINMVIERFRAKDMYMNVSSEVLKYLTKEGYNPHYGARPLKRLIQNKILNPIASLMVSQTAVKGSDINVGIKNDEFVFDVKRKKRNDPTFILSDIELRK